VRPEQNQILSLHKEVITMIKYAIFIGICALCIVQIDHNLCEDWPQLGHDAHHTYSSDSVISYSLKIQWKHQIKEINACSPSVVGDKVYFLSWVVFESGKLSCLDLGSGKLLYEVPAFLRCPSTPTVIDNRVYIAAERDLFQCLDAASGDILWERELPELIWLNPLVQGDLLFVTVDNKWCEPWSMKDRYCTMLPQWLTLLALDKNTGEEIWRFSVVDDLSAIESNTFPILVNDTILFHIRYFEYESSASQAKSDMICLDAYTGDLKWRQEGSRPSSLQGWGSISPYWLTYYKNNIYMNIKEYILCVDGETRERVWEYKLRKDSDALLSVGHGVVVGRGVHYVYCLDADTGEELWKIPIRGYLTTPALTEKDVFIGSTDGTLYRIDVESGKIKESYYLDGVVFSPVVADRHVLVGTSDNMLYCLGSDRPLHLAIGVLIAVLFLFLVLSLLSSRRGKH
jgi:outer membrane protein assembly factor BamB